MRIQSYCLFVSIAATAALSACGADGGAGPDADGGVDAGTDVLLDGGDVAPDATTDVDNDIDIDIDNDIDPTLDRDDDGLPDLEEITVWGTNPTVADTDGDGFSDFAEVRDLAFDADVNNFQFNPLIADRPILDIELALAPVIYATYSTTTGTSNSIGNERSDETRTSDSRSWGGANSYAVEQSHTGGASVGFSGWEFEASVSYEYSYSTTRENSTNWSNDQTRENANTLTEIEEYEENNEFSSSGGVLGVSVLVRNLGNIAYFLDNLTLTAYELDPLRPEGITPVGTLTFLDGSDTFPRTRLDPGEESAPLSFDAELDLPTVKALLANSRNLMIAPATWLVEGDGSVDFELAATAINARTAEVIIDYGFDRDEERYRISTVADEDRNFITAEEALTQILRIPYSEGAVPYRRTDDGPLVDTMPMLSAVRNFETSDEDTMFWTVIHSYPTNNGADTQTDQYHPFISELNFGELELQKGHTLQLVRVLDVDRDGLGERSEYAYGTDPTDRDSDDDGCTDGFEVAGWTIGEGDDAAFYRSNPAIPNTDFDLYSDCEEYVNGTDPIDHANIAPDVSITLVEPDGVRAVFEIEYDDFETGVLELRYSVNGGDEQTVDVEGVESPYVLDLLFSQTTPSNNSVVVIAFDGGLDSAPARIDYAVGAPARGLIGHWPIEGEAEGDFFGALFDWSDEVEAMATFRYATGRNGTGFGGADLTGGGFIAVPDVSLGAAFSVSAWYGGGNSLWGGFLMSQHDVFHIRFHTDGETLEVRGFGGNDEDAAFDGDIPSEFFSGDRDFALFTLTYDGEILSLYFNGQLVGSDQMLPPANSAGCSVVFGTDRVRCDVPGPEALGLDAVVDDLRIYDVALSENEVLGLFFD